MKKILFLILFMCISVCAFSQSQKVYSDTVYSEGKIIITNYIINEKQEKVNVIEPTILALDLFLNLNPWFDWRYPHYGWYNPGYIYRPWHYHYRPVPHPRPVHMRPPVHNNRPPVNFNNRPNTRPHGNPGSFNRGGMSRPNMGRPSGSGHFGGRR